MATPTDPFESNRLLPPDGGLLGRIPTLELASLDLGSFKQQLPAVSEGSLPSLPAERFRILEFLGQGGQGLVARAEDLTLGRHVAVKWLRSGTPQEGEALLREARTQASLEHPHICRIYETGLHQDRPYIVMQLVQGLPITQAVAGSPLAEQLKVLRMAAEAAHAAHSRGLIHRDLKPGNILVERTPDGQLVPRLLDFGLATQVEALRRLQAQGLAAIAGTPAYMAPEQTAAGVAHVDQRTDVWALGVILFELLTGDLPFRPTGGLDGLIACHLRGVPDPSLRNPALHPDLKAILLKAMAHAPEDRYATARAFAEDLAGFLAGRPITARRAPLPERTRTWVRHHRAATAGIALGLLLASLSAGIGLLNRSRGLAALTGALQFEERCRDLELQLHRIRSLPAQQVGAAYATLRSTAAHLELEAARAHRWKRGPACAALGRLHLALGDPDRAREHFEQARTLGFFPAEVALGLGLALAESLDAEIRQGVNTHPEDRMSHLQRLREAFARPALTLLQQHRLEARQPELIEARCLALEGRLDEGIRRLESQLALTPWAFEHRRLLASLRVQRAIASPETDPALEAMALEATGTGTTLSPGDALYPLLEGRLHTAAFRRGQHGNQLLHQRREAAETALRRALQLDPALDEAEAEGVELCLTEVSIRSNRLEDSAAAWDEGLRRCHEALRRRPDAQWARMALLRLHAERAHALLDLDDTGALKHAEAALTHLAPLRGTRRFRAAAGAAALARLTQARCRLTLEQDPLADCETALALLDQAEPSASNRLLRCDVLTLRALLRPDGRADREQALALAAQPLQGRPPTPGDQVNLAILTLDAVDSAYRLWGTAPGPGYARVRELLAAALQRSPDLAPRIAGLEMLVDQSEASCLLEHGQAPAGLRARMQRALAQVPAAVRPWAQGSLDQLDLAMAAAQGRGPAPCIQRLRRSPAWESQKTLALDGSLALAMHETLGRRPASARPHLEEALRILPALAASPNQALRHHALRAAAEVALLQSILDPGPGGAARARAAADQLQRTWPDTPAAAWCLAVAGHLERRPQDWKGLTQKWPQLQGLWRRFQPLLAPAPSTTSSSPLRTRR